MPLDPRLQAVLALLQQEEPDDPTLTAAERRAAMAARREARGLPLSPPMPEGLAVSDVSADGVPVRVYRPRDGVLPAVVYLHGGGWWLGTLDEVDPGCANKALDLDAVVISVDYRLAPENPYPAGLDDCVTVAEWVFRSAEELGIDPARVAVCGASAGGNLAAATAIRLREAGGPQFVAQVLEVPGMDLRMKGASMDEYGEGFGFTRAALEECASFYVGPDGDVTDPLVSPVLAELHDLPPALVTTCECDPIRDSGEDYAARLAEFGVPVTMRRWDGMAHGAVEIALLVPDVAAAYREELNAFLRPYLTA